MPKLSSARSKILPRAPSTKSRQQVPWLTLLPYLSLKCVSTAVNPLQAKSRSRYSVSSRSKTSTSAGGDSQEDGTVVSQHGEAVLPVVAGNQRHADGSTQDILGKMAARVISKRIAAAEPGVDLEYARTEFRVVE